ncbi:hypothetical protein A2T82_00140 [Burkholderia cenocepacia]|nr:hypothetical protein A2T82_00140 [Burkholderia cenocepacia]
MQTFAQVLHFSQIGALLAQSFDLDLLLFERTFLSVNEPLLVFSRFGKIVKPTFECRNIALFQLACESLKSDLQSGQAHSHSLALVERPRLAIGLHDRNPPAIRAGRLDLVDVVILNHFVKNQHVAVGGQITDVIMHPATAMPIVLAKIERHELILDQQQITFGRQQTLHLREQTGGILTRVVNQHGHREDDVERGSCKRFRHAWRNANTAVGIRQRCWWLVEQLPDHRFRKIVAVVVDERTCRQNTRHAPEPAAEIEHTDWPTKLFATIAQVVDQPGLLRPVRGTPLLRAPVLLTLIIRP